jgi:hypothetical protein
MPRARLFPRLSLPALAALALLAVAMVPMRPVAAQETATTANALAPLPAKDWNARAAGHLLRRAGFGGTPAEIAALVTLGMDKAVASLVNYETIANDACAPFECDYDGGKNLGREELRTKKG